MGAARDDVVARTFRGRPRQHRRLDVDETVAVEEPAHRDRHFMAQHQVAEHVFAAQVEVAVLQANVFVRLLVMVKRRGFRLVEHFEFVGDDLYLARAHIRVYRALRARADQPLDLQHALGTNALGLGENPGAIRIENHLQQAFPVAKIDEDDAAVIAAAVNPAADLDFLAVQRLVDLTAIVATHWKIRGKPCKKEAECYGLGGRLSSGFVRQL